MARQAINIEEEMKTSYLNYAMSVIVGRALPDVRDGLKPVQRRILYAMLREGLLPGKKYSKCAGVAGEMLADIDKGTVDFIPNFDETTEEPVVLPSAVPNLIINGSSGIAVGMATNIPPHNLGEVVDGLVMMIENPEITIKELYKKIKGPDFPTASIIHGKQGILDAYNTGRGLIKIRARVEIEEQTKNI